jgi:hypothetical protein
MTTDTPPDFPERSVSNVNISPITPIIQHLVASQYDFPNAFGARLPISTPLKVPVWEHYLAAYSDRVVVDFLRFGWPLN